MGKRKKRQWLSLGVTEVGVAMAVSNVGAVVSTGIRMVGRLGLLTSNVWFLMFYCKTPQPVTQCISVECLGPCRLVDTIIMT